MLVLLVQNIAEFPIFKKNLASAEAETGVETVLEKQLVKNEDTFHMVIHCCLLIDWQRRVLVLSSNLSKIWSMTIFLF